MVSLADKSLGQGMVVAGLFKCVIQFCFKTLLKKCRELLWFVFSCHIRVRVCPHRSVLLHGSSRSVLLSGTVMWRGAVHLLCDLWNVPPCPPLSPVCLWQDHQRAQHNCTDDGTSVNTGRGGTIEEALIWSPMYFGGRRLKGELLVFLLSGASGSWKPTTETSSLTQLVQFPCVSLYMAEDNTEHKQDV